MVNTIAPYSLTKLLLPILPSDGRVVNLSSAAQTSVQASEIGKTSVLSESAVYAKSKIAITMWTSNMADILGSSAPVIVAVNPASMLGSKMVQDAYGIAGGDVQIGADILVCAALSEEFATASGKYFDNDIGAFSPPHPDALNKDKCQVITDELENIIANFQR